MKHVEKDGFHHIPGFLSPDEITVLIQHARDICTEAPLRRPSMPDGTPLRLTLTNAGPMGWWSDAPLGYRYVSTHPTTGRPWPAIPSPLEALCNRALEMCDLPPLRIDNLLLNHYAPGESLGLHVDRSEKDLQAPIVSLSIGADALFLMGGRSRSDATESYVLSSGDMVVQAGAARRKFHGIKKLMPVLGNPLKNGGRLNFTFRKVLVDD